MRMTEWTRRAVLGAAALALLPGCLTLFGGGRGVKEVPATRRVDPADVLVPEGYRVEVVATGLNLPVDVAFDAQGTPHVLEAGYSYGELFSEPRLLRVRPDGSTEVVARGSNPPWTGVRFHGGSFFVSEGGVTQGGRIVRVGAEGQLTPLVEKLPSLGDHHTNGPAIGPDGWVYFSVGTATNSGVVGPDNSDFGWLERHPEFHDVPCKDVTLTGQNYESPNPLTAAPKDQVSTGAFLPFGQASQAGQVVKGQVPCSGAVMRVRPEGGPVELVAWGFRNPFGLGFSPDGALFVAENGFDERGSRPVWGAPDALWRVEPGSWYGWPDYAAGRQLGDRWHAPPWGKKPALLLKDAPARPSAPVASLAVHSSSNHFDFSREDAFGHRGQAFVAQFGDMSPNVGKVLAPVGYKVVRVDVDTGVITDFVANRGNGNGPASLLGTGGLERPNAARFSPDGKALYVVDFGLMPLIERKPRPQPGTGVLWRIVRTGGGTP